MSGFDHGDKTEPATPRRRLELRRRGHLARSGDLTAAAMLLAASMALYFFGGDLTAALAELMRKSLSVSAWKGIQPDLVTRHAWDLAGLAFRGVLPLLALAVASAVFVNLAQVGFLLTVEPVTPDPGRIDPAAGLQRLLSRSAPVTMAAGLLKLAAIFSIAGGFVVSRISELVAAGESNPAGAGALVGTWLTVCGLQLSIGLFALAALDYGYQLWKYERDIRMTKQELRDELRQTEGDPQLRQRRREAHRGITRTM